jgi:type III secretory pathway component EscS
MPKPRTTPKQPVRKRIVAAPKAVAQKRPAEVTTGVVGAVVALIAAIFDITDAAVLTSLIVIVGFIPAAITWLVNTIRGKADAA